MIVIEKLNAKNTENFNALLQEAKSETPYRMDFYRYYDNQPFFLKYFIRKLVKLLKYRDEYIGYMWTDLPSNKSIKISDMYLKNKYISLLNKNVPLIFKSDIVLYEGYEDPLTKSLINSMKMNKIRVTNLMRLNIQNFKSNARVTNATFKDFIHGEDEKLRMDMQNSIFNEDSRTPLSLDDIKFDMKQEYYIKDLCVFIKNRNKVIGYGQIIFNRGIYLIVNFGIIEGYRREGYGKDLILKLIDMGKAKGINDLYIRVDYNNIPAKKLYKEIGFIEVGDFCSWLWAKELIN